MILELIEEAVISGARLAPACQMVGLSVRTVQRWRAASGGEDGRQGPKTNPRNKLSPAERQRVLAVVNGPEFQDLSPKQIVPRLADGGEYLASESTLYRILREEKQLAHREPSRPRTAGNAPTPRGLRTLDENGEVRLRVPVSPVRLHASSADGRLVAPPYRCSHPPTPVAGLLSRLRIPIKHSCPNSLVCPS